MTKKKKRLNTRINKEKSNKMIIAVAIGVVIVLVAFFLIAILGGGGGKNPADKKAFMEKEMNYLKNTDGIAALNLYPDLNKVVIVYEGYKEKKQDFAKIAWYAALKLSRNIRDENVTVIVAKDKEENVVHSFTLKNGVQVTK